MSVGLVSWCLVGESAHLTFLSQKVLKWIQGHLLNSDQLHHGWSFHFVHVGLQTVFCLLRPNDLFHFWLLFSFIY